MSIEDTVCKNPTQGPTIIFKKDELLYRLTRLLADYDARWLSLYRIKLDLRKLAADASLSPEKQDYANGLMKQIDDMVWR